MVMMTNKYHYYGNSNPTHSSICPKCVNSTPSRSKNIKIPVASSTEYKWLVDSGASVHCVNNRSMLTSVYKDRHRTVIQTADKRKVKVHAVGTCELTLAGSDNKLRTYTLHNVVYHPSFPINLLSSSSLVNQNCISTHITKLPYLMDETCKVKIPLKYDDRYKLPVISHISKVSPSLDLLHERFGHCSFRRLSQLSKCVNRLPHVIQDPLRTTHDCPACNAGKARKRAFAKKSSKVFRYFGERLSSDICGPFPASIDGYKFLLCIVDGYSGYLQIIALKTKSSTEVLEAFKEFLVSNKNYLPFPDSNKPITWHTDNGGEFVSADVDEFCQEFAVHRSFSVPYAPPQNAHAERMWGIILKCMRAIMYRARIHGSFWTYAAQHACYLHNILPTAKFTGAYSPYQIKFRSKPDVKHIKVWGCLCWYYLPAHERKNKISPRAVPAIHLGPDSLRKGYIVYVPYLNRITTAYHLNFQESSFLEFDDDGIAYLPKNIRRIKDTNKLYKESSDLTSTIERMRNSIETSPDANLDENELEESNVEPCSHPRCTLNKHSDMIPHSFEQVETRNLGPNPVRHPNSRPNYDESILFITEDVTEQSLVLNVNEIMSTIETPTSYSEAIKSKLALRWRAAMDKEIEDLLKHNTWELVSAKDIPKECNVAKSKWVYKVKMNKDGSIERFKARFVVCGYSQVHGVDYTHSFSATMRATSFRLLLALAAGTHLRLDHFDVTSAFTQSDIDSLIYVRPPLGYEQYDKKGNLLLLKLKKALYGTKQASRMWQLKLRDTLIQLGFSNSTTDPCLFVKEMKDKTRMIVGVYVDDIIVAHKDSNPSNLAWFKSEFCKVFRATHLGRLSWFLGVAVEQREDYTITISQNQYVQKLIEKFITTNPKSIIKHTSPCNVNAFKKLAVAKSDIEKDKGSKLPYLQLIGSLVYLATMTRPDISYYISTLCSFMHSPTREAYQAAIDLLLYVYARPKPLEFFGSSSPPLDIEDRKAKTSIRSSGGLLAYSDSSWRSPNDLGYNMMGYAIYFYGSIVSYASKHMKIVALSSAEAEYAACAYTCKEIIFIRNVLKDLKFEISSSSTLAVDNRAAIDIANNLGVTARNKHFKDTLHYFRHLVDHRIVYPIHVSSKFQRADGMTKCLERSAFRDWCKLLYRFDTEESQH